MNFLDQNNDEIIFQVIHPNDIEATATCISQVFSNFEPMAKFLKISFNDLYKFALPICQKAADEKISLIAKDRKNGGIVGFIISEDLMTVHPQSLADIDYKFTYIFSLLSALNENYRKSHPVQSGQVLHMLMLGVEAQYTKRHIATNLVINNLNLAKHHNFKIALTEATGVYSQQIFRKLGFTEEFAIEYKSYQFQGKHVFSSLENPSNCLLMSYEI